MPYLIQQISEHDIEPMQALMTVFGTAFAEQETYTGQRPGANYLRSLLANDDFIALVAIDGDEVVGGLTAYVLRKYERERSEIYIYDLAVAQAHRRQGVATALIAALKASAASRGAYLIMVQADTGEEDQPAIELYSKLGVMERILHFDIAVEDDRKAT